MDDLGYPMVPHVRKLPTIPGIDNFVLRFMGSGDNPALRLVGLIRLVRLIRLLHLVKDLARMVKDFVGCPAGMGGIADGGDPEDLKDI